MKQVNIYIDGQEESVSPGLASVADLYKKLVDPGEKRIFLKREDGIDIPLLSEECMLIHGGEKFVTGKSPIENDPPLRNEIRPEFNGSRKLAISNAKTTGKSLKERDDRFPQGRLFADIKDGVDVEIRDDMTMVVQDEDSYFVIPAAASDNDIIDVEECSKNERKPPKGGKGYRIRIDGERYPVDVAKITGVDILALAGKHDNEWSLNQKLHGGRREKIGPEDKVDLARPGIERFETVRRQAQQGEEVYYDLPCEDVEYLDSNYPSGWKKIAEGNGKFGLLIENFSIPGGYTTEVSTLMLLIPSGYPGAALDMFCFDPPLEKSNGSSMGTLVSETHFSRSWQRWSRHYTWQPGVDSIVTHIEYVKNQLAEELKH